MRPVVVNVLELCLSPVISPSARNRRSEPSLPWSTSEVDDERWGHGVSDLAFKMIFLFFLNLNE